MCRSGDVRLAEPVRQNAVFGNAVEHAVRTDNRGIHGPRENHCADYDDETVEDEPDQKRPFQIHGQAADEVFSR